MNTLYSFLLLAFAVCFLVPVAGSVSRFGVEGEYMTSRIQAFLSSLICLFMVAGSYYCFIEG